MANRPTALNLKVFKTVLACWSVLGCATTREAVYFDSALNDKNRAPASIVENMQTHISQMPDNEMGQQAKADYNFIAGDLYSQSGEMEAAIDKFKEAHYFDPQSALITYRIAIEYFRRQSLNDSIYWGMKSVERDPTNKDYKLFVAGLLTARRDYAKAEELYLEVVKEHPKAAEPHLYLASLFVEAKKFDLAKKHFTILTQFSDFEQRHVGFYYRGKLAFDAGLSTPAVRAQEWTKAKADFEKALALKPDFMEALQGLGRMIEKERGREATFKYYIKYQEKHGPIARLAENLAQYHIEKGDFEKALEQLQIVEAEAEDDIGTKLKLALILIEKKRYADALVRLERLNELVPDSDKVKFYMAAVLEEMNQADRAAQMYSEIPSESGHFEDARVNLAQIYKKQGNFKKAETVLVEALSGKSEKPALFVGLAQIYELQEKWDPAITTLKKALEKFPDQNQFNYFLGLLFDRKQDFENMVVYMRRTIANDKNHYQALNHLAYSMAERNENLDEARELAYRAHKLALEDGYILDTLGWIYFKLQNYSKAKDFLEQAHELLPEVSIIAEHLGDVYMKLNQKQKASKVFKQAFTFETDDKRKQVLQEKLLLADKSNLQNPADSQSYNSTDVKRSPAAEAGANEDGEP